MPLELAATDAGDAGLGAFDPFAFDPEVFDAGLVLPVWVSPGKGWTVEFFDAEVGVILQWNIVDPTGAILDLSGATGTLLVPNNANSPFALVIANGPTGAVQHQTVAGQWPAGDYEGQCKFVLGTQTLYTHPTMIRVMRAFV